MIKSKNLDTLNVEYGERPDDLLELLSSIIPDKTPLFPNINTNVSVCGMSPCPEPTFEESIADSANVLLEDMRDYRDMLMELPDDKAGRMHSHDETDNTRGLRIRAISIAITEMESSMKRVEDAMDENLKEYYMPCDTQEKR